MGEAWDFEGTARKLSAYFDRQDQDRLEYAAGGHAAREWLRVMQSGAKNADLAGVRALVEGGTYSGSGWTELRMAFKQWVASGAP